MPGRSLPLPPGPTSPKERIPMITFEDLQEATIFLGRDFPTTEAWIHQRGFDEDDLYRWLVRNAIFNLDAVSMVAPEVVADIDLDKQVLINRHATLVGLSIGYELGFR